MEKNLRSFAFFVGAFGAALSTAGCTTHQCDATNVTLGADDGGTGAWISYCAPNATSNCQIMWSSSATMNSPWTDYPGNATLTFTYPPLPPLPVGFTPDFANIDPSGFVAAGAPIPDASSFNVTPAAGQLAEFTSWSSSSISVFNASCQEYQLLLQVTVPVLAPDSGLPENGGLPGDGGVEADGGIDVDGSDAGSQADSTISE